MQHSQSHICRSKVEQFQSHFFEKIEIIKTSITKLLRGELKIQ